MRLLTSVRQARSYLESRSCWRKKRQTKKSALARDWHLLFPFTNVLFKSDVSASRLKTGVQPHSVRKGSSAKRPRLCPQLARPEALGAHLIKLESSNVWSDHPPCHLPSRPVSQDCLGLCDRLPLWVSASILPNSLHSHPRPCPCEHGIHGCEGQDSPHFLPGP